MLYNLCIESYSWSRVILNYFLPPPRTLPLLHQGAGQTFEGVKWPDPCPCFSAACPFPLIAPLFPGHPWHLPSRGAHHLSTCSSHACAPFCLHPPPWCLCPLALSSTFAWSPCCLPPPNPWHVARHHCWSCFAISAGATTAWLGRDPSNHMLCIMGWSGVEAEALTFSLVNLINIVRPREMLASYCFH